MKTKKHRRKRRNPSQKLLIMAMALLVSSCLVLLLWDEGKDFLDQLRMKKIALKQTGQDTVLDELVGFDDSGQNLNLEPPPFQRPADPGPWPRVYPFSVVDGGVHSVEQLKSAMERDPAVARHFSNFRLEKAQVIEAGAARSYHVSYRNGNGIFWTKKKITVPGGERLITDGQSLARTRCGNRLSQVLLGETAGDEPDPGAFDTPFDHLAFAFLREALGPPAGPGHWAGGGPAIPLNQVASLQSDTSAGGLSEPQTETETKSDQEKEAGDFSESSGPEFFLSDESFLTLPHIVGRRLDGSNGGDDGNNPPPSPISEPATAVLILSGLITGYWLYRVYKKRPVQKNSNTP